MDNKTNSSLTSPSQNKELTPINENQKVKPVLSTNSNAITQNSKQKRRRSRSKNKVDRKSDSTPIKPVIKQVKPEIVKKVKAPLTKVPPENMEKKVELPWWQSVEPMEGIDVDNGVRIKDMGTYRLISRLGANPVKVSKINSLEHWQSVVRNAIGEYRIPVAQVGFDEHETVSIAQKYNTHSESAQMRSVATRQTLITQMLQAAQSVARHYDACNTGLDLLNYPLLNVVLMHASPQEEQILKFAARKISQLGFPSLFAIWTWRPLITGVDYLRLNGNITLEQREGFLGPYIMGTTKITGPFGDLIDVTFNQLSANPTLFFFRDVYLKPEDLFDNTNRLSLEYFNWILDANITAEWMRNYKESLFMSRRICFLNHAFVGLAGQDGAARWVRGKDRDSDIIYYIPDRINPPLAPHNSNDWMFIPGVQQGLAWTTAHPYGSFIPVVIGKTVQEGVSTGISDRGIELVKIEDYSSFGLRWLSSMMGWQHTVMADKNLLGQIRKKFTGTSINMFNHHLIWNYARSLREKWCDWEDERVQEHFENTVLAAESLLTSVNLDVLKAGDKSMDRLAKYKEKKPSMLKKILYGIVAAAGATMFYKVMTWTNRIVHTLPPASLVSSLIDVKPMLEFVHNVALAPIYEEYLKRIVPQGGWILGIMESVTSIMKGNFTGMINLPFHVITSLLPFEQAVLIHALWNIGVMFIKREPMSFLCIACKGGIYKKQEIECEHQQQKLEAILQGEYYLSDLDCEIIPKTLEQVKVQKFLRPSGLKEVILDERLKLSLPKEAMEIEMEDGDRNNVYSIDIISTQVLVRFPAKTKTNIESALIYRLMAKPLLNAIDQQQHWSSLPKFSSWLNIEIEQDEEALMEIWWNHLTNDQKRRYQPAREDLQFDMTTECFMKMDEAFIFTGKKVLPRTIAAVGPNTLVATGPWMYELARQLKEKCFLYHVPHTDVTITYGSGICDLDLDTWFNNSLVSPGVHIIASGDDCSIIYNRGERTQFISTDFSAFDASQGIGVLEYELEIYEKWNIPERAIEALRRSSKLDYKFSFVDCKQPYSFLLQKNGRRYRDTGGANTSIGNTLITLTVMASYFSIYQKLSLQDYAAWLGLSLKIQTSFHPGDVVFLKGKWWRGELLGLEQYYWAPLPSRFYKMGKCNQLLEGLSYESIIAQMEQTASSYRSYDGIPWIGEFCKKFKNVIVRDQTYKTVQFLREQPTWIEPYKEFSRFTRIDKDFLEEAGMLIEEAPIPCVILHPAFYKVAELLC